MFSDQPKHADNHEEDTRTKPCRLFGTHRQRRTGRREAQHPLCHRGRPQLPHLLPDAALAHYLWVEVDAAPQGSRFANLYFEESPKPGDGSYLDHFLGKSEVWIRTIEDPSPAPVRATEVKKGENRWMRVDVPSASEFSVDAYGKFGVYEYGKTKVLLHYYARHLAGIPMTRCMNWDGLSRWISILSHTNWETRLNSRFCGKANRLPTAWSLFAARTDFVRMSSTDAKGRIEVPRPDAGTLTLRSSVEEQTPGKENGEAYELVRHNITLVMPLATADD